MYSCLKTTFIALTACALPVSLLAASSSAHKELGDLLVQNTAATHYIWTDDLVYLQGSNQTLRWTASPNNDPYPYTLFVYRENVESGDRMYLDVMSGALTDQVIDAFGNTAIGGYLIQRVPDVSKLILYNGPVPSDVGYYHFVAEIRDFTGTRVVRAAYAKFSVVDEVVQVPGGSTADSVTWENTKSYVLSDTFFVLDGGILNIEPGTIIKGQGNSSVVVITQGGKIMARGTRARPIVMTCNAAIGQRGRGCWGGLVVNGRAPINREGGVDFAEGLPNDERGQFGGNDPDDSSGYLGYVRVEFAGIRFSPENELNGIAFHGVGRGTTVHHIQVHQSQDDGVEFFGGTVGAKYVVVSSTADDSVDWVLGWQGKLQFVFVQQKFDDGDRGIEADNLSEGQDNQPRSMPTIYNATLVGDPREGTTSSQGVLLREGTAAHLRNFLVTGFGGAGLRLNDDATFNQANQGNLTISSMMLWFNRGGSMMEADQFHDNATATFAATQTNIVVLDPGLRKPFDLNDPDPRPVDGASLGTVGWAAIPPDDGFFVTGLEAQCIGAFCPTGQNWIEGWTFFPEEENLAP